MTPELAHLVNRTIAELMSKTTSYLHQKAKLLFGKSFHLIYLCLRVKKDEPLEQT